MHKIPSLTEQFVYFNDDMFLIIYCRDLLFFIDQVITAALGRVVSTL